MGSSRGQGRRQRQQVERRRERQQAEARKTQQQQAEAAIRDDFSRRRRRHAVAYMLLILAGVLAVYHLFEHLDIVPAMTGSSGLDDIVAGWPLAGLLAITGAIKYGT